MIPKPLRKDPSSKSATKKPKSKEWNPATFFIFIFLLIGSMSIQMIALRNEFTAFTRRADAKIGLLKEIIGRIQKGEEVDVEGLLGTGNKKREQEWEEGIVPYLMAMGLSNSFTVLQEIEREDQAWDQSRKPKPKHGRNLEASKERTVVAEEVKRPEPTKPEAKSKAPSGFY
jgi:hypothetical protein